MLKTISRQEFLDKNRKVVFKVGNKQVLLLGIEGNLYAIDNRCPHEGYPLSEGTTDDKACVLTCNWHNWKFDLKSGKCFIGGDNVRTYPVKEENDSIIVDLSDPTPEEIRDMIMEGFQVAFERRQFGRISREVSRLHFNGLDPLHAVKQAILWSYDKFEYGMTHAYAAMADWLALYESSTELEDKIICLTETIDHIAFDSLRHPSYPFCKEEKEYTDDALLNAIENENNKLAESLVFTRLSETRSLKSLEEVFSKAALAHYNDFGHSLIYVEKAIEASEVLKDFDVDLALGLSLARSLSFTSREDLIPEFKNHDETISQIKNFSGENQSKEKGTELPKVTVNKALEWGVENFHRFEIEELYDEILKKNALNFLQYDLSFQSATNNPVTKNVGWLSFTHALTFSNAVRRVCTKYPELWPAGITQMLCFYGRNSSFTDENIKLEDWLVDNEEDFQAKVLETVFDHGMAGPIFSAHIIKTGFAIFEEAKLAKSETRTILYAALNRFLNSPLKQKHVRRLVSQGIKLVAQDFK